MKGTDLGRGIQSRETKLEGGIQFGLDLHFAFSYLGLSGCSGHGNDDAAICLISDFLFYFVKLIEIIKVVFRRITGSKGKELNFRTNSF